MTNEDAAAITTAMSPRELVAFAFVEEAYSKTGDLIAGLVPLFVPILARRANRRFDPAGSEKFPKPTPKTTLAASFRELLLESRERRKKSTKRMQNNLMKNKRK